MKHILVAHDLSQRADMALARGLALGAEHGAAVTVIHVVDEDMPGRLVEAAARDARELLAARLKAMDPSGTAALEVKPGLDYETIMDRAGMLDADLVLAGPPRPAILAEVLTGSTLERCIRIGHRPVLVVRRAADEGYHRILVAVDLSPASAEALHAVARAFPGAALSVVHVLDLPSGWGSGTARGSSGTRPDTGEARQEVATFLTEVGIEHRQIGLGVEIGAPVARIQHAAARLRAAVVAVGSHGRSGAAHMLMGSVAEEAIRALDTDVLVVPVHSGREASGESARRGGARGKEGRCSPRS